MHCVLCVCVCVWCSVRARAPCIRRFHSVEKTLCACVNNVRIDSVMWGKQIVTAKRFVCGARVVDHVKPRFATSGTIVAKKMFCVSYLVCVCVRACTRTRVCCMVVSRCGEQIVTATYCFRSFHICINDPSRSSRIINN